MLPLLHADGIAVPERLVVDRAVLVGDFPAVVRGPQMRERRPPVMGGQEKFLIVISRLALRFHIEEPELAAELSNIEISLGRHMRVIPARPDGSRLKRVLAAAVSRNNRRSFLHGAIDLRSHKLPMPVHKFRHVRVVVYIDSNALAFAKAQDGARDFAIVPGGFDYVARRNFKADRRNAQRKIGLRRRKRSQGRKSRHGNQSRAYGAYSRYSQELSAIQH